MKCNAVFFSSLGILRRLEFLETRKSSSSSSPEDLSLSYISPFFRELLSTAAAAAAVIVRDGVKSNQIKFASPLANIARGMFAAHSKINPSRCCCLLVLLLLPPLLCACVCVCAGTIIMVVSQRLWLAGYMTDYVIH